MSPSSAAAGKDALRAQYNLGVAYLNGDGRERDPHRARALFEQAAEGGFAPARSALGYMCLRAQSLAYDPERAAGLFVAAAESGYPEAQYRCGELCATGLGLEQDMDAARTWFREAAGAGHQQAQCQLAYCLEHGLGGAADPVEATRWYTAAARQGDARAQACLAWRHEAGHTVAQDPVLALAWHLCASAREYPGAGEAVERLRAALSGAERAQAEAHARDAPPEPRLEAGRLAPAPAVRPEPLSWQPRIFALRHLVTVEERAHLVANARPYLRPSMVLSRVSGQLERTAGRRSGGMSYAGPLADAVVRNLEERMARHAMLPVGNGEPLAILRYETGDEYRPHFDYFDADNPRHAPGLARGGQRLVTIVSFLSSVAGGGETSFPEIGLDIRPEPGTGVLFWNCTPDGQPDPLSLHAGAPVTRGEKWLATKWIREREWSRRAVE